MNFEQLEYLIHPITKEDFFQEYWNKKSLYIGRTEQRGYYNTYFDKANLDFNLNNLTLRHPIIELISKKRIGLDRWTKELKHNGRHDGLQANRQKLTDLFSQGQSILFNHYSRYDKQFRPIVSGLNNIFDGEIRDYLVLSVAQQKAFTKHFDKQHVCILQLSGKKRWFIYDTYTKNLKDDSVHFPFPFEANQVIDLEPGDFLYVPACLCHSTETISSEPSISSSITVDLYNGIDFLERVVNHSYVFMNNIRKSLPHPLAANEEKQAFYEEIKNAFIEHLKQRDFEEVLEELKSLEEQDHQKLDILNSTPADLSTLTGESKLSKVKNIVTHLIQDGKLVRFKFLQHSMAYYWTFMPVFKYITEHDIFTINDLPNMITLEMKQYLVKDLIEKGLLHLEAI